MWLLNLTHISFSTSSVVNGPLKDLRLAELIQTSWISLSQIFLQHSESLDFCCKAKKVCGLRKNISLTILQSLEFANPPLLLTMVQFEKQ